MSRRRSRNSNGQYKWLGHITLDFNKEERDSVLSYVDQRAWDFENVIVSITQKGHGIKFTYDQGRDCYLVTLQPKGKDCYLTGYTLSYTHVELSRLVQIAAYVVFELIEHQAVSKPGEKSAADW